MSEQFNNDDIDFKDSYLRLIKAISSSNIYLKVYEKNSIFVNHNGFNQSDFDALVAIGDLSVFENWGMFSLDNIITTKKHVVMTDEFFEVLNRDHEKYPVILSFVNYNWVRLGVSVERALKYPNIFINFDKVRLNKKTFTKLVENKPTIVLGLYNSYADLKNYMKKPTKTSLKYLDNVSIESYLQLDNSYHYNDNSLILDDSVAKVDHRVYLRNTFNKLKSKWQLHLSVNGGFSSYNNRSWKFEEENILDTLRILSEYYDYINTNDSYREFITNIKINFNEIPAYPRNKSLLHLLTNVDSIKFTDVLISDSNTFRALAFYISAHDIPDSLKFVCKKISEFFVYYLENFPGFVKIDKNDEIYKVIGFENKFNSADVLLSLQEKGYLEDVSGTILYIKLS